ncbi:SET domain-containing protein, partial [Aureobasidium melanogenum]
MEDSDSPHGTTTHDNIVKDFKKLKEIKIHPHPAQSPDLDPIKGIWLWSKEKIRKRGDLLRWYIDPNHDTDISEATTTIQAGRSHWLMKTEPESRIEQNANGDDVDIKFSIDDLHSTPSHEGRRSFFYESNCKKRSIVGIEETTNEASPDSNTFDKSSAYHDPKSDPACSSGKEKHIRNAAPGSTKQVNRICAHCVDEGVSDPVPPSNAQHSTFTFDVHIHAYLKRYLSKWKHEVPSQAVLSWHYLDDLASIADSLQTIKSGYGNGSLQLPPAEVSSLKRKSLHDESLSTRASSIDTSTSISLTVPIRSSKLEVWNGVLLKKSGDIYPHPMTSGVERIDATTVPTPPMLSAAKAHLADGVKQVVRRQFLQQLASIPGSPVTFVNEVNKETPSLSFTYIQDYVLGEGVSQDDADAVKMGCKKCRPDMGGNRGCEYTTKCDCLEFAAPDELRCKDDEQKEQFAAWISGEAYSEGLPKRFPYKKDHVNNLFVLGTFYLDSRNAIYECNELCRCGSGCKNRLVQKG